MEPPAFPAGAGGLQTVRAAPGSDADLVLPPPNGTPPFHYVWSRAGASLDDRFRASEDAGGVRLTVSAARTGDSGIYTLQASNAAGKDTRRLRLEVSAEETPSGDDPPTFLRRLQDLTVKVGTRTRFLVEIVSSTECKVTWYRNERRLMEAERVSLVRDGNFWCADVAAVSVDDAGRWTCTAENIGGRASCSAHLNVLVPKAYKRPEFVEELRAVLTEQGTVSLECKVVGVPTPILRWFKDSREIKAGDVFALTANAEDPTSLGTYTCEAVNCMGRAYSSSKVHVIGRGSRDGSLRPGQSGGVSPEPPLIFTKELEAQSVKICDPLTLSCHIVVPPWPRSVVWYNKEGKIEPNERYHVTEDGVGGYLVEVTSSEWRDEGEWKCVATSAGGRLGITTCYVTMEVPKNFRKPRFMENLQAILTEEGLVSFECKVVGFPTPVLSWFKDGQELKPGDVYQLTGTNSLGSYCCIARNCMGQASSSAELTVEDIQNQLNEEEKLQLFSKNQAPKFLLGLKSVEARIDEPFRFTVKVAIPPEPSVLWYRDDQPVDDSPRCHLDKEEKGGFFLDIRNLEFLDQAEWKCVAINDFGHSVTSCFLKLIIPRHYKKPRFLENLQAILSDEGAVNLECKVIGVPQPVLKWYKDGEELKPGDIHRIISGQDGTCCLGTYTCEAQNCMGIAASSASLLGFDDSMKIKSKKKIEEQTLQRNLSLSTIHEERTSQMYDTPVGDITLDDKGEVSFSFDGKEVSVSLYETPDLTEEEALQIVEMYADQLSENITEHNVVELPPLRFVKETSNSGNLLMEAIIIDVSPEYFASPEEDLRTEADIEDISIADENAPSQLSFDQEQEEKILPVMSDDKYEISHKLNRKKSDSQRSADEYFSLSREHSLSEEKRDEDTEIISESDLLSFASAHSSGKPKTKIDKVSPEDANEALEDKNVPRTKSERKISDGSRKSSTESEKSLNKHREDMIEKQINPMEQTIPKIKLKETVISISTSVDILVKEIQKLENEIILKSEFMSSVITASKSVEIINSVLSPLSEINRIINELKVCLMEANEVNSTLFYNVLQSLKSLQQALTIIEKCIDVESENRTLVKKTCVLLIEKCSNQFQDLMMLMKLIKTNGHGMVDNKVLFDIDSISNEIITIVNFTAGTIKTNNLLIEADKLQAEELSVEAKHLRDTQKGIQELKRPLTSLLNIVKNAEAETSKEVPFIHNSSVILADMSESIQDLQCALEQIEVLSVKENSIPLNKYNTDIINSVLNPVLELRNSFEQLSTESKHIQDKSMLNQKLISVKSNINDIFSHLSNIEESVGAFDILQNDNKLETLQKMANILILLESNLTILDHVPSVKENLSLLHKKLTKILENVIESNEAKKYYDFVEICDVIKGINNYIQNDDSHSNLSLVSVSNALNIIKDCLVRNVFDPDLNKSVITIISEVQISIQEIINQEEHETFSYDFEYLQQKSEHATDGSKANNVMEHIDQTLAVIATVVSYESLKDQNAVLLQPLESVIPILEELKNVVASFSLSGIEREEHVSEITEVTSQSVEMLAKPLFEMNRHLSVLSEIILEDHESIKGNHQPLSQFAQALSELCETLEIVQHDIISQFGEHPHRSFSFDFAETVQSLHSAILMIQNNIELEVPDELSTLEDISGLKTTADTVQSDHLAIPIIEHKEIQEILELTTELTPKTSLAHILNVLNKHIEILQNPEREEILEKISKSKLPPSLSLTTELANLQLGIQEILHPTMSKSLENIFAITTITEIGSLSESMIAVQQILSQITTENIPILEDIVDISSDLTHSVNLSIAELKEHLDKCIEVILPALHITDVTIKVSNNIATLKETCELLCDLIADASASNKTFKEKLKPLNFSTKELLDSLDVSKKIDVKKIKYLTEELYKESSCVGEEILSLAPLPINQMEEEAHLLQVLHELESSISILQQYEYVGLSTPQQVKEIEPQILCELGDILITTSNVMHYCKNHYEDQEDIQNFIAMCQNKFIILRSLINENLTYKRIIRLYQEFILVHNLVNLFKENILVLRVPRDLEQVMTEFLENTNNFLDRVRIFVVIILEKQMELIFATPMRTLTTNCEKLVEDVIAVGSSDLTNVIEAFLKAKEIILPSLDKLDVVLIKDLNLKVSNYEMEENIINAWEKFEEIFQKYILMNLTNAKQKLEIDKAKQCIQMYNDLKASNGRAKQLILLKSMAECSEILKDIILESKQLFSVKLQNQQFLENSLSQMYTDLSILSEKLREYEKKLPAKNSGVSLDSYILNLNEKFCKFIVEHKQTQCPITVTSVVKSLILKLFDEIQSVKMQLKSFERQLIPMTASINNFVNTLDEIEKLINALIYSQQADNIQIQQIGKMMDHIDEFVSKDTLEVIKDIAISSNVVDAEKAVKLATELKENISAIMLSPEIHLSEETLKENLSEADVSLAFELQQALSVVITEINEKAEELSSQFDGINMQQVQSNLTSLSSDLKALITSAQVMEKTDDVKQAVVESENAINLDTVTEGVAQKEEGEVVTIGKMMDHIDEFVSKDTLEVIKDIAISSNVVDAEKAVKLATELKENISAIMFSPEIHLSEETLKENLSEADVSLAFELQQALSVVITEINEKAEELSSQFDGINMQQVQSNLTSLSSDLKALTTSAQVIEKTDDVKQAVVESENAINLDTVTEGVAQKEEGEVVTIGKMMDHIDEFVSKDTLEVIKDISISSNVVDAEKAVKLATELRENISAIMLSPEIHLSEETLKENLSEADVSLAFELQQALSVVITEINEKAEELSSQFDGINMQQVQSNLTSLSSDLKALITSAQVMEKTDDVKQAVVESENAINLDTVTEGVAQKEEGEVVTIGKMMDHIDEFVSKDTLEVIKDISISSNVVDAEKAVKLATELRENISAIMLSPEIHLSEETLKENLSEADVSLAFELQQALSVVITEINEKAEELSSQFDGINMQQVQSNLTSLSSDLKALITSAQVMEKTDDVKQAVVESENAINLDTVTEGVAQKEEGEVVTIGKMMDHIDEFVSKDTLEVIKDIAISSNVVDAEKAVKLATELKENILAIMLSPEIHLSEETLKENLSEADVSLAFELQQALSVVITEINEKAEELSSQFDGINMQQVQSNLTSLSSDLKALITSAQVIEKTDDVKQAVVESENAINLDTVTEGVAQKEEEVVTIGKMMDHIDEFVSKDTLEVIKDIAISSNVVDAEKAVKLATELKENISAIMFSPEIHLSEETLKENLSEADVSLAFELQQALSVVITEINEKSEELSSQFDGINMQQVQSNLTSLSSDLKALITSAQVIEKTDDVKQAVVESENAINLDTVTEGVAQKEEEVVTIGKMMDHIDEFVSKDTLEVIKDIAISSNVVDAEKAVKLATELKENISAIMFSPEIHLSEETLKENLTEADVSLAFELQQALSVVITEINEQAKELSSQFNGINMQQVQSNLTSLSSDLKALITSAQVMEKTDDVKQAVVESENAINLDTVTEGVAQKEEGEVVTIGKMMDHIDEFVSKDTLEVIKDIAISSNVVDAEKAVNLATELKENISAIMFSPEIHLSEETLKENLSEADVSLAFELQQALSVVITEINEKAEELSSQFDGINMQQVQSNLTSLSSDLKALITSAQVMEKTDDVKQAVVESENAINLDTVTEGVAQKEEGEVVTIGKMMDHIDEFVSKDTLEVIKDISISSNVVDAEKAVKLATELRENISAIMLSPEIYLSEETLKENLSEADVSLAFELQQALSVVITEINEKAEELSSQFDGINMQQVQSNLTSLSSDLKALITSAQVMEKTDDVKQAVVESENAINLDTVTEGVAQKEEGEVVTIGKMMDHIDEFVSKDTLEVIKDISISSNVVDAEKAVKLATELRENISAIMLSPEIHLSEETLKENLSEADVSLAFELQQALSVVITEINEKAEELSSQFDGINMQQVQSNLTSLSSDLKALITSAQVIEKTDDVKQAVVESENAINLDTVTEGVAQKEEGEVVTIGKMMDHIDEFVSKDTLEVIKDISISSNVVDAEKAVKLATELRENISAIMLSPEIHLSEETLKENLSEADVSLAFELQQALSVVITEINEKAEELSSQFDGINMQQVQSNLTSLSSDLKALITSAQVIEKTDDVKQAVVESENAINLDTVTEGVAQKEEGEVVTIGKMMDHIDEFVSKDTLEVIKDISISSNVVDAEKAVKLATELRENISAIMLSPEIHLSEETLKENLSEADVSLAFELQQALSVVITEINEKAEELSSQFDGINMQQVQSNLTSLSSDLKALITSAQVIEKTDDVKQAVVESENAINLDTVTEGVAQKEEGEVVTIGKMMDHIDEFVSKDTLEVIKDIAISSNVVDAEKAVKLATELKENISAIMFSPEIHLSEETLKENLTEADVSLAFELQQALSVVITEINEKADELSSQFDGINMQQVQSNLTSLSSDLKALITSAQVIEKTDDVKQAVVESENAINLDTVTEGVAQKEEEVVTIGKMMDHIDKFVSKDTLEVIKDIAISSNVVDAEKAVKLATELKENISAIMFSPEIHLSEETLKENLSEADVSLAFELQQALSVVITEINEKAEELSSQFDGINMQQVQSNLTSLSSDLKALITSAQSIEKTDDVKQAVVESENAINLDTVTEGVTQKEEEVVTIGKMMDHIDEFVSKDTLEVIKDIAISSNVVDAEKAVKLATELKENISAIMLSPEIHLSEETLKENLSEADVSLAFELQQALSVVIKEINEKAEELSSQFDGINMQQVQSNLTSLSSDLKALITSAQVIEKTDDVKQAMVESENAINLDTVTEGVAQKEEGDVKDGIRYEVKEDETDFDDGETQNTLHNLKSLLKEVCDKIDTLATSRTADDIENLQNTLDEIQAVIIALKRDYSESLNDTLNESLQDLECSVRSVQLQINEESPPELVKEACETLQVLVSNMCEMHEFQVVQTTGHKEKLGNIITSCSNDTEETIHLLESALSMKSDDEGQFNRLYTYVNELKLVIKSLQSSFADNSENLIEKGIEIMQNLDQIEDQVFALEKEVDTYVNLNTIQRDSIVTAIHSVYGSISNMRSAMSSVQKHYMYENYGKSSELILNALKCITFIANKSDKKWKTLSKSLRKVLNHFEDIKFYINFDKTARIPGDASFTKIILLDLKATIESLIYEHDKDFGEDVMLNSKCVVECLEMNLLKMESKSNLQVKEKIPIFKSIGQKICALASSIKEYLELSEEREKVQNIEALQSQDSKSIQGLIEVDKTEDIVKDELRVTIEQIPSTDKDSHESFDFSKEEKDSTQYSSHIIENVNVHSENINSTDDIEKKEKSENTSFTINTHAVDFALEILPETIMTEYITEASTLNLETHKPFEAPLQQIIDTGILYKAHVNEAVIESVIDTDSKGHGTSQDSKEFKALENEKLTINQTPEGEPKSDETIDYTLSHSIIDTNETLKKDTTTDESKCVTIKETIEDISKVTDQQPHKQQISTDVDEKSEQKGHDFVAEKICEDISQKIVSADNNVAVATDNGAQKDKIIVDSENEKHIENNDKFENNNIAANKCDLIVDSEIVDDKNVVNKNDKTSDEGSNEMKPILAPKAIYELDSLEQIKTVGSCKENENNTGDNNEITHGKSITNVEISKKEQDNGTLQVNVQKLTTEVKREDNILGDKIKSIEMKIDSNSQAPLLENTELNTNLDINTEAGNLVNDNNAKINLETKVREDKDTVTIADKNYNIEDKKESTTYNDRQINQDNLHKETCNLEKTELESIENNKKLLDFEEVSDAPYSGNGENPIKQEIKIELQTTNLLREEAQKSSEEDVVSQNSTLKQIITNNDQLKANNCINQSKEEGTVLDQKAEIEKRGNIITHKIDDKTELENKEESNVLAINVENKITEIQYKKLESEEEKKCTDEEATTSKHPSDKEKPRRKKKDIKSKKQVHSPLTTENKDEESETSEVKDINVFQRKDTLEAEKELKDKSKDDSEETPNVNESSKVSKSSESIILDDVLVQERQNVENLRKDKIENENIDVETDLSTKDVSKYRKEVTQTSKTLNSNNLNIEEIQNTKCFKENDNIDNTNESSNQKICKEFDLQIDRNICRQLDGHDGTISKELEDSTLEPINMSKIKKIEITSYDKLYSDETVSVQNSGKSADTVTKNNAVFIDRTSNNYENEFLRPPGYVERTFNNDHSNSELDVAQNYPYYKAQTLVRNTQYTSPFNTDQIQSNELVERKDVSHKLKALNETRSFITEKRSKLLRDVKRKPVFSTYLTDRTAVEGSRVKLTCSVLTTLEPRIVWYKNGVPLDNKLKYRTKSIDGLLTMEVLNAEPSDSAEYSCTVETENGSVTTSAILKVYPSFEVSPIPPTFTRSIRDKYHLAENELVLECRIRGQPLPTITWLKDDRLININERYEAFYLADGVCRLTISNPSSEDSGKYTCKAENSMWSDQISHIVTFTGIERFGLHSTSGESSRLNRQSSEARRPHFTNVLSDYKVSSGGTIGLQVEIKGSPTRVEWLREGHAITDIYRNAQTFVDHGLYTLALSDVTEKESGIYTCRAWSRHGNVDMTAAITVVQPNEIDGKPAVIIGRPQKDVLISVGEDLNISFRVQGEPKPKVTLMKGIRDITNSPRVCKMKSDDYMKFTLKRSVISDAGTYCILARNAYGCDRAFVTVVVRQRASSDHLISDWTYPTDSTIIVDERRYKSVPNRIPGELSVVDGGNNWISLAWPKVDPEGGAPVSAYKIESWLLGKEGGARWTELGITPLNSFEAYNLKQGEEYHFRVTPRNRYGWGESVQTSNPVGVGLAGDRPEFVEVLPGQLKVLVAETATLKCSFKGKPTPEIVWMKNGHEIDEEDQRLKTCLNNYNCSLTIHDVQINDEARYSCEATNVHGRASTYARIAVVTDKSIWEADTKLKRERSSDGGECPPQFTMRLRDRRVQATYPVRLTCQVIGRPPPLVTWYKNGEEVIDDNRHTKSQDEHFHTLEIAPTTLEDGGVYEATARNGSGAISCRCNLVVDKGIRAYIAPEFCCGLEPLYQLSIGQELRISAVVEAYPSVGVTWYRDGVRLRPSRRAVMTLDRDGQIELAVGSVTQRDAGVYTCTASNEVGKASTSGKVEVFGESEGERKQAIPTVICSDVPYSREPTFIRKPRSSEAYEGDTIIIECEVTGDPKPDVFWLRDFLKPDYYRDGSHFKRVGDGPEYRFEIPHAKFDYTGAYSVVARNVHGEAKAVISLQILAKDPRSTEEAHNVRYGRVEVIPRFEKDLTDLLSHDGDAVEFECRVTGEPEPDIKWYHYTKIIRECSEFEMSYELGTARLKIKQVTADDEGTYTCEAYNYLGKATSKACLVVYPAGEPNTLSQRLRRPPVLLSAVSTPRSTPARSISRARTPGPDIRSLCSPAREIAPKFYTYPYNKVAEEGDTVVFQCAAKGLPAPWATWDKDGVVITPSSRITIKEKDEIFRILEIDEVNSEDVGLYRVTLENDYGRAEATARLEVISQKGKFYASGRSYSASPRKSLPYKRSMYSLPRQD